MKYSFPEKNLIDTCNSWMLLAKKRLLKTPSIFIQSHGYKKRENGRFQRCHATEKLTRKTY